MHDQQQVIKTLFATNVISYISVIILLREVKKQSHQYKKLLNLTTYMATLLEKSDVVLDEFDIIALKDMGVNLEEVDINEEET